MRHRRFSTSNKNSKLAQERNKVLIAVESNPKRSEILTKLMNAGSVQQVSEIAKQYSINL